MDSPTSSSPGTIAEKKLKIWKVFSDLGPEAEEILKAAKFAYVYGNVGLVVTMEDKTYYFYREDSGGVRLTKIPELCGVRVKEFIVGYISLALTEDGQLFVWRWYPESVVFHPVSLLTGSLTGEKVKQVALSKNHVLALTFGGRVHSWLWQRVPTLIAGDIFEDKKVVSVACNGYMQIALTEDGELFEWKSYGNGPQKSSLTTSSPIKKITASKSTIFVLTVDGTMHSWKFADWGEDQEWMQVSDYTNVQDIAACVAEDVSVVELKTDSRFGRYVGNRAPWREPFFTKSTSLDESFAEVCQTSYRTMLVAREPEPRKVCDDISNLWRTKKNADVKFSVGGKIIAAHKFILTTRSEYFEKMFSGEWAEAEGDVVDIKDTKHDIFEALLFYIYHDRIRFSKVEYENLFDLMKLADSYCDVTIRRECEKILMENIDKKNAFFLLRNAASANALDLEEEVTKFILDNRLFGVTLSPDELLDFLGKEAFVKLAMAAFCR